MKTTREKDEVAAQVVMLECFEAERSRNWSGAFAEGCAHRDRQVIAYLRKCARALESGLDPDDMSETLKERVRTLDLAANAIERGDHVPVEAEAGR